MTITISCSPKVQYLAYYCTVVLCSYWFSRIIFVILFISLYVILMLAFSPAVTFFSMHFCSIALRWFISLFIIKINQALSKLLSYSSFQVCSISEWIHLSPFNTYQIKVITSKKATDISYHLFYCQVISIQFDLFTEMLSTVYSYGINPANPLTLERFYVGIVYCK